MFFLDSYWTSPSASFNGTVVLSFRNNCSTLAQSRQIALQLLKLKNPHSQNSPDRTNLQAGIYCVVIQTRVGTMLVMLPVRFELHDELADTWAQRRHRRRLLSWPVQLKLRDEPTEGVEVLSAGMSSSPGTLRDGVTPVARCTGSRGSRRS